MAHTWGVFDGDKLAAYLLMVQPEGVAVSQLDYFAVVPQYRAGGLGAAAAGAGDPEHPAVTPRLQIFCRKGKRFAALT